MTILTQQVSNQTILEALRNSITSVGRFNPNDVVSPVVILWADADRQWSGIIPQLQLLMPELFIYGDHQPDKKQGSAIWLRCVIDRALENITWPEETIPVIYLPGISRQTLRAVEECPDDLKPLVELQYRGVCWTQKNGRDWTVEAFLVSKDGGLDLELARDDSTKDSLRRALPELVSKPVAKFQGRHLDADDFNLLMVEDSVKDLLTWLNNPRETEANWSKDKWSVFQACCKKDFEYDPDNDGEITGGEKLGIKEDSWLPVWERFSESPALYPGITDLLCKARPSACDLFEDKSSWPTDNEAMEDDLRKQLEELDSISAAEARRKIIQLEETHGPRRDWVWARLGNSPLANSLKHLHNLAQQTEKNLGGNNPQSMADLYKEGAWRADLATIYALAAVKSSEDSKAIQTAIRSLYLEWLQKGAEHFQKLIADNPLPVAGAGDVVEIKSSKGCVLLFADGLRWDLANELTDKLRKQGLSIKLESAWSGLPTVTATAKPIVSPVSKKLKGNAPGEDFSPDLSESNQTLTTDRFRKLLKDEGCDYISPEEAGDPSRQGWTEYGELDKMGHHLQAKLVGQVINQIELMLERVNALIEAGWKEIKIVTDHGWLLLPGGLPKVSLPKYLTESRWARCASIKEGSKVDCPTVPWYWNPEHRVAIGPGISCFAKGNEYAHGGASLQECLIPIITVKGDSRSTGADATIQEVKWIGLRCRVKVQSAEEGVTVDIRTKVNDAGSSTTAPKTLSGDGTASLVISDDSLEGSSAVVVLISSNGKIFNKQATIIGGE